MEHEFSFVIILIAISSSTLGAASNFGRRNLTWLFATLAAYYVGGLSWPVTNLFGAIIVVTDSSVMMTLLRQHAFHPRTGP